MSKNYRLGVVFLVFGLFAAWNLPTAVAQRITAGGATPSNKKDKDQDDDKDRNKGNRKDRGNQGGNQNNNNNNQGSSGNNQNNNQASQGGSNNQNNQGGNSSNAGGSNKGGNKAQTEQLKQFQQLMQQRRGNKGGNDDDDRDRDPDNRGPSFGPGDNNKLLNPGQPGFNNKLPNQPIRLPNPPAASPANKKLGHWQDDKWQGTQKADTWVQVFGSHDKPFSAKWYQDHPQAWRYDNNRWNVWIGASVPGVYSWLGWGPAPREYSVGFGPVERFDPNRYGDWYPLGVFSLQSGPDDIGTRVVQLAVDRRGNVTGNYFDMITNVNHNVTGGVDRDAQRVMWWLNRNPSIQFHARIYRLLQPYGSIYVELPGGDQRWQFVRLEDGDTKLQMRQF